MTHETFVSKKNLQDVLDGIEQKIAGLGSTLTGIYTWQANNQYKTGDVCILNGSLFICLATHTSSPAFSTDIANWNLVYSDIDEWASSTYYVAGASVIANNAMYKCKTTHTSGSTFDSTEEANWDIVVGTSGNVKIKNWATTTQYKQYDVVMVNNNLYRCVSNHTSTTFSSDISNWELIYASISNWQASTYYPVGVFAINDKKLYKCKTQHTSGSTFSDTNWDLIAGGGGIDAWATSIVYNVGDIVLYNGSMYRCSTAHTAGSTFSGDIANWSLVYTSVSNWSASNYYPVGACAIYNGILYQCTTAHTSTSTFADANWSNVGGKEYVQPYEDTPLGTIISFMGKTAPEDYLICDGTVYNIADYGDLADFINTQFGSYNFFGGNGTTTFAVPDLRGEFLRGSGTNSRTRQGSGASVGVHQNATEFPYFGFTGSDNIWTSQGKLPNGSSTIMISNQDSSITGSTNGLYINKSGINPTLGSIVEITARPTNTSVLYCIKYTNAPSMQPSNIYSTTEKRIGTWIDGKPLYQITYSTTTPSTLNTSTELVSLPTGVTTANVIELKYMFYTIYDDAMPTSYYYDSNSRCTVWIRSNGKITCTVSSSNYSNTNMYITIKYTKT